MIVVPDDGSAWLLQQLRPVFNAGPLACNLYQNDYFPTLNSVIADFTDATYPGYVRQNVNFPNAEQFDPQGHCFIVGNALTFLSTGAPQPHQRIYGYYISNAAGNRIVWAERFPRRVWVRQAGVQIVLSPRFGALTEWTG